MSIIKKLLKKGIQFKPAVVCFPVRGNEVLLMHRKKTSDGLGQDLIAGIGGKVGDEKSFANETHDEAMIRECLEEVGIEPTEFQRVGRVQFLWETKPNWNMDVEIYIVRTWIGEPQETSAAKPTWHDINALPEDQMWEDYPHWVPQILAGESIDIIFLYGADETIAEILISPTTSGN